MTPGRFHLVLTVSLAGIIGFGASHLLSSNDAVAYPSGPTVSYGANPVFSLGGYVTMSGSTGGSSTDSLTLGHSGQEAVITDIVLTSSSSNGNPYYCTASLVLTDSTDTLAEFGVVWPNLESVAAPVVMDMDLGSGIRVQEGETLTLTASTRLAYNSYCSGVWIHYTLSGWV